MYASHTIIEGAYPLHLLIWSLLSDRAFFSRAFVTSVMGNKRITKEKKQHDRSFRCDMSKPTGSVMIQQQGPHLSPFNGILGIISGNSTL